MNGSNRLKLISISRKGKEKQKQLMPRLGSGNLIQFQKISLCKWQIRAISCSLEADISGQKLLGQPQVLILVSLKF